MPKRIAKAALPVKPCLHCGRPMVWRKRWKAVWEEVRYCSERCRRDARLPSARVTENKDGRMA